MTTPNQNTNPNQPSIDLRNKSYLFWLCYWNTKKNTHIDKPINKWGYYWKNPNY